MTYDEALCLIQELGFEPASVRESQLDSKPTYRHIRLGSETVLCLFDQHWSKWKGIKGQLGMNIFTMRAHLDVEKIVKHDDIVDLYWPNDLRVENDGLACQLEVGELRHSKSIFYDDSLYDLLMCIKKWIGCE